MLQNKKNVKNFVYFRRLVIKCVSNDPERMILSMKLT